MPRWVIFELIFLGSCGYALWRGGMPERVASAVFLVAATLSMFLRQPVISLYLRTPAFAQLEKIQVSVALIDLVVLLTMLWLALFTERFWPLWMAAMAAIIVLTHMSMLLGFGQIPWAYWNAQSLWSYPMQLLLAVATWRHRQRLRRFGADRSWRRSFSR